jgi:AcrR family transcriptional regulator
VESLTSYLTRLAYAHGVTIGKLAAEEFAPLIDKSGETALSKFTYRTQNLNGMGVWTQMTLNALETLTCRNDIRFLTMYPWHDIFSRRKLLRHHLAWCPVCYQEWQQSGQTIYHPLLWTLNMVQLCPHHGQALCHRCPYPDCQKCLTWINSKVKLGYCPYCKRWLGAGTPRTNEPMGSERASNWHLWSTQQLAALLAATPHLSPFPQQHTVVHNIRAAIKGAGPKRVRELARDVGVGLTSLFQWMRGDYLPQLESLARVCYCLHLSLLDLLATQPDRQVDEILPERHARPKAEARLLQHSLEPVLHDTQTSPCPAKGVARQLGVSTTSLRRRYPEQYRQIIERYEQHQQAQRQLRKEKLERGLKVVLEDDESPPLSMKEVARRLQIHPATARELCPELCRSIANQRKIYYETKKRKAEASLKAILAAHEEPPPSITEVAIRLDVNIHYLYQNFSALCRAVTQRYRSYQPPQKEQLSVKRTTKRQDPDDIRRRFAAFIASEETPPPSLMALSKRLDCSPSTLSQRHSDLCQQLHQQQEAHRQTQKAILERKVRGLLADNAFPPLSVRQVARRLEISPTMLRAHLPALYADIVNRHQAYRQGEKQRRQVVLDQVLSEHPVPPPPLSQVAKSLSCDATSLQRQFPEASQVIVDRYRAYRTKERQRAKAALETALSHKQRPPLLPIQVARQLGYEDSHSLFRYFPEMCHQLSQREEAHRRQIARAQLEAVLAEEQSEPPLSLGAMGRQLGYSSATLKHLCPDLCRVITDRYRNYWTQKKLSVKYALEAILSGEKSPAVSVQAIAREFGYCSDTIRRYFPDLTTAVSATYKMYLKARGQQRRQHLDQEVKRITRELYHQGIDPTLYQIGLQLPQPAMAIPPHTRQAWREARKELGLPT